MTTPHRRRKPADTAEVLAAAHTFLATVHHARAWAGITGAYAAAVIAAAAAFQSFGITVPQPVGVIATIVLLPLLGRLQVVGARRAPALAKLQDLVDPQEWRIRSGSNSPPRWARHLVATHTTEQTPS